MEKATLDIEGTCRNIRQMLEERKITAKEVQKALELESVQTVYKWLSPNNTTLPSLENLIRLKDLMNCSVEDILVIKGGKKGKNRDRPWICKKCGAIMEDQSNSRYLRNTIILGEYWQGLEKSFGKSPIEWTVLKEWEDGRMLVISSEVLDCQKYDDDFHGYEQTWKNCFLRRWLNETFLKDAFSPKDQEKILEVTNKNPGNDKYEVSGGEDTTDKIFLLSVEEVSRYFLLDEYFSTSSCSATKYARAQGAETLKGISCKWWLRTPGLEEYGRPPQETYVNFHGQIVMFGSDMRYESVGVRPAMMIDRSKF